MGIIMNRLYVRLRAWYVRKRGWSLCPMCDAVIKVKHVPPWVWTLQAWCQECYHDLIEG